MTRTSKFTAFGLLATLAATVATPVLADQQSEKNNMRNLAIAGVAIAGYGLLNHNNAATLLGAAGAALAGSQYEKDRQQQSQDNYGYYDRRYHRTDTYSYGYRNDNNGGRYNTNGYNTGGVYDNGGRNNNGNQGQWRNDYNSNRDYNSTRADSGYNNGRGKDRY